ncbi:MAG: TonB-dependent receptor, partial [Burkholderiales bacterium]|nr:TonB-dependent receptor [Burkholderiales bacterium]
EEGFGLRPNIGIRGLNPTRSTKILLLEDGIPLTFAPYGDNASYYHPPIERFERIEVLKGAEQIKFGPQTIGGVINYITPIPPQTPGGSVTLTGGKRDYFSGQAQYGTRNFLFDYSHKQGDGSRDNTHSNLDDFNLKSVFDLTSSQALTLRANYNRERSDVGYTGITDAEFRNFGARYNPFDNDTFDADRAALSATHALVFNENAVLTTNLYGQYFSRDWWRQSSRTTDTQCDASVSGFSTTRLNGGAVNPDNCNSIQGRLRDYYTYGVEPRLNLRYAAFGVNSEADIGVRAHFENQDRQQVNGTSAFARSGTTVEDNERDTRAFSAFAQNRFIFGNFSVTPGLRVERVLYERENRLANGVTGKTDLTETIPSLGATFNPSQAVTLFTGVHRGFAPPSTADILNNNGGIVEVDAEKSWNFELGARARLREGIQLQATYFRNDFQNQIVVGSVAGGDLPLAQGETLHEGIEFGGRIDSNAFLKSAHNVFFIAALTYLPTAEITAPFAQVSNGALLQGNTTGNRLPYAPETLLTTTLGYEHPVGIDVRFEVVHVGEQFSDFANTGTPAAFGSGLVGQIASHTIFNAAVNYRIKPLRTTVFLTLKNLTDKTYIVDRTRGILPGLPRLIQAGLQYDF